MDLAITTLLQKYIKLDLMAQVIAEMLKEIEGKFGQLKWALIQRLTNSSSNAVPNHTQIYQLIYNFSMKKPTIKEKAEINRMVRRNIKDFISTYVNEKAKGISGAKDPHAFVQSINGLWMNFQRFVFAHEYACSKLDQFFETFHKMANSKDFQYEIDKVKYEVAQISTIAVNQLNSFFANSNFYVAFKGIFSSFLLSQREGKAVPREQIRQTVHCFESCFFDMEAKCSLNENGRPTISKRLGSNELIPMTRRATDNLFFEKHLLKETLQNCKQFYLNFVNSQALVMNPTDEISKMLSILNEEEARCSYYIHTAQNRKKYLECINENMINYKMEERIRKADGLKKYFECYEEGKEEYERELKDFWKLYSRVSERSLPVIKSIYSNYLLMEAEKVSEKTKKPPEFIQELIRINSKSIKIVEFFNGNFELQNERNLKIRGMLSNDITEKGIKQAKFDIGARNLASFINNRFKTAYVKGGIQSLGDVYKHIVNLFKILQEKTRFIHQEDRYMGNRLLEDIDFSKDIETQQIVTLQKLFIEEIMKESGVNEVKQLSESIKDIQKSIDISAKLKTKLSNKVHPLNQIIVKTAVYWAQKSSYTIDPPLCIFKPANEIDQYFKQLNTNIQFQHFNGVSSFRGDFQNGAKQNFQFKNIYMIILLLIDQQPSKKLLFGNIKKKIEAVGAGKQKGQIQLARNMIELLYSGLLVSSTKQLRGEGICKITESDQFQINTKYNFVEEQKRKAIKGAPPVKPLAIVKTSNLLLSQDLRKAFDQELKLINNDEKNIQVQRKYIVECITVKTLKHAHHHKMDCTFDQLFKETQAGRNKEHRVNEKYLKEIVEELINKKYCERVQGQRNVFRYIA